MGSTSAVVAVPDPARAFVVAGLATLSRRHPLVVTVPTTTDAERLSSDLRAFLGPDAVDLFPAWETLPFERVSPGVETMGRRLRALWRLRNPDQESAERSPRVLVAPVRALVQRLGPHVEEVEPVVVRAGDVVDPVELVERLVATGYRREYVVEHRGEVARRGSIVDVFPSTADSPVRIDLWGDEVDRLSEFSVTDQRSTDPVKCVEIFPCREVLPTEEVRARAAALVAAEPWGRDSWERLAEGMTFDGMESWLPWLTEGEHTLLDLLGPEAQVLLVEPRRMRDRAAELADEEAALARSLATTWGASPERDWPRLHLPFDRLLASTHAPAWTLVATADSPDTPSVTVGGWDPVLGDPERLARQVGDLLARGFTVVVAADGQGSAARLAAMLSEHGVSLPVLEEGQARPGTAPASPRPGAGTGWVVAEPLERGFVLPELSLAVLVEADVTGRRRAHRRPRPRRTDAQAFFDDLQPGDYVVHHQHGVARYGGMVSRALAAPAGAGGSGGAERDYLLLEYRGGDRLYVPSDQIDAVRHYTGGDTPSLHRMGGAEWQRTKARVRAAVRAVAEELVALYRARIASPGHA